MWPPSAPAKTALCTHVPPPACTTCVTLTRCQSRVTCHLPPCHVSPVTGVTRTCGRHTLPETQQQLPSQPQTNANGPGTPSINTRSPPRRTVGTRAVHRPPPAVHRPPSTACRPQYIAHRPPPTARSTPPTAHRLPTTAARVAGERSRPALNRLPVAYPATGHGCRVSTAVRRPHH